MEFEVDYANYMNPIKINDKEIPFVKLADRVGILRPSAGSHPIVLAMFKAHRKAVAFPCSKLSRSSILRNTSPYVWTSFEQSRLAMNKIKLC